MKPPTSLRESLEQAIVENPDDLAAHMAHADYLVEQGEPWGEFIQTQLALEEPSLTAAHRKRLQQREQELFAAHGPAWLGELAPFVLQQAEPGDTWPTNQYRHSFRRGWLDMLHIGSLKVNYARALVRSPQTRLLRDLTVVYAAGESEGGGYENEYEPGDDVPSPDEVQFFSLHPLVRSPYLVNVRRFHLGNVEEQDDYRHWEGSYGLGGAAADLIARMPRIEDISLWTVDVDMGTLFAMPLPHLRRLQIHHMNPLELPAANPTLANLTTLQFHPHHHERFYDDDDTDPEVAYIPLSAVTALLQSTHLPKLKHLQLRVSSLGDEGIRQIIDSGWLDRLEVLDLRHGCVTDEGARRLAECPATRRLRVLDLNRNRLTSAGVARLKALGIDARVENQWGMGDDGYYTSYLHEGDFE
jgi:uncharacterized protein (TIGR02996 family)